MNKASRLNRQMLFGTLALGVLVIGIAMGMLYYSFQQQKQNNDRPQAGGDSISIVVDSAAWHADSL